MLAFSRQQINEPTHQSSVGDVLSKDYSLSLDNEEVDELLNVIERAVSFADGPVIRVQDLPDQLRLTGSGANVDAATGEITFKEAKERWVSSFERDYIVALLKKNEGNISHAAREADIDRKYFRKLMRKYGIEAAGAAED